MGRGYIDFARRYGLNRCVACFVTRARIHLQFRRPYSYPADRTTGLRCDQTILSSECGQSQHALSSRGIICKRARNPALLKPSQESPNKSPGVAY